MIDELHVQSVALIRDATIRPAAGLTVLTGETGAGKTALLSALKLLADGHVVRRRVEAAGRGRVSFDGHMASVAELAQQVGSTVDLCGQHEHQRLMSPAVHAQMLDAWTGEDAARALSRYQDALRAADAAAAACVSSRVRATSAWSRPSSSSGASTR